MHQRIIPHLWFDQQAEEAVNFYITVFDNARINAITTYPNAGTEIHHKEPGSIMTIEFQLDNFKLVAHNGGPMFKFNPSISLFYTSKDLHEIKLIWNMLAQGGKALMPLDAYDWSQQYGWIQDKFGISWQLMLEGEQGSTPKMVPLLLFTGEKHGKAEDAVKFYTSVFMASKIEGILHYGKENDYGRHMVMHSQFQLDGQTFMAMDRGVENDYPFNEAVSFLVMCKDQVEVDYFWEQLGEGGDPAAQQCGWLKDKFGVSWQVIPEGMDKLFKDPDLNKARKAMEAMLQMKKIDLKTLTEASKDKTIH